MAKKSRQNGERADERLDVVTSDAPADLRCSRRSQLYASSFPARASRLQLFPSRSCTARISQWVSRACTHINQSHSTVLTANQSGERTRGGSRCPQEPMEDARWTRQRGGSDVCAGVRVLVLCLDFFLCVYERVAGISAKGRRESPRARTTPEPVQTGRGEVWFGLVWIPTPVSLMLRVETIDSKGW